MPGSIPAGSSIIAWMFGADITLSSSPSASRLGITVPCGAYAASSVSPGANRCRGTAANAAATRSDPIAPSRQRPYHRGAQLVCLAGNGGATRLGHATLLAVVD